MKKLLLIFLLLAQLSLVAQTSWPTFSSGKKDSSTLLQYFPTKADLIFSYSEESYWWSNIENFKLLVQSGNTWTTWIYYKKWKRSSDVYANKGKKKSKNFKKLSTLDSSAVKKLFDSLAIKNFWTLNSDSINQTRGLVISDAVNYKFQIEKPNGREILASYAPEYYIEKFPDMQQRIIFIECKDVFLRWWKQHAAKK